MSEYTGGTSDADFFSNINNGPGADSSYGFASTIEAPSWLSSTWNGFTSWFGGTSEADFESNLNNGPEPGTGYGGFASDPNDYGFSVAPVEQNALTSLMPEQYEISQGAGGLLSAELNAPTDGQGGTGGGKPPATGNGTLDSIAKALGPQGVAALITSGFGMLNGASQGKMLEKKWKREDDIRQQEIARKERNQNPGRVAAMRWSPGTPAGTGILGERVG